jgi:hypothetical protein
MKKVSLSRVCSKDSLSRPKTSEEWSSVHLLAIDKVGIQDVIYCIVFNSAKQSVEILEKWQGILTAKITPNSLLAAANVVKEWKFYLGRILTGSHKAL